MKARFLISSLLAIHLLPSISLGQDVPKEGSQAATSNRSAVRIYHLPKADQQERPPYFLTREQLLQKIAQSENAIRNYESSHGEDAAIGKAYAVLAVLYEDAALYPQAEPAYHRAISLLGHTKESNSLLAITLCNLGGLHIEMGKLRQAKKEELQALQIRESLEDQLAIARSYSELSVVSLGLNRFEESRDFAQKAITEFRGNQQASPADQLKALYTLAQAACGMKDCQGAIPVLKDGIELAKASFHPTDFPLGLGYFLLGYANWKSGNIPEAEDGMKTGISIMDHQLGWGHPAYLTSLRDYDQFLRENHRAEEAKTVESRLQQINSVVDVRTLAANQSASSLMGLR